MGTGPGLCQRRRGDGDGAGRAGLPGRGGRRPQLAAETQAECLRGLERAEAVLTAARASVLAAFTVGQGLLGGRGLQRAVLADAQDAGSPAAPRPATPRGPSGL